MQEIATGGATRGNIAVLGRVEAVLGWNTVHLTAVLGLLAQGFRVFAVVHTEQSDQYLIKQQYNESHTHTSLSIQSLCVRPDFFVEDLARDWSENKRKDTACALCI